MLISLLALLSGCTKNIEVHAPDNGIVTACQSGNIGSTTISCISPYEKIASEQISSSALVVYIEPGDYNSNLALQDENVRMVASSIPSQFSHIKPHLRQIMINLSVAHIRHLVETYGSKYQHIYFFRSDLKWSPESVGLAFKNVLSLNQTVDILLQVHGSPGEISLDADLQTKLNVADLKQMENTLSMVQRDRVRNIFNSACYSASFANKQGVDSSIAQSLVDLFPRSMTYGSFGVNYGPLHRDMVSFESYYAKNMDFSSAQRFANRVLTTTIASGYVTPRASLDFPVFSIKGQARYFGFRKTEWQTVKLPALLFPETEHWKSVSLLSYGNAANNTSIHSEFSDRYYEVDLRAPAAYLQPASCSYKGRFIAHSSQTSEFEYITEGTGENMSMYSVEYKVACNDGKISRTQALVPAQDNTWRDQP